MYGSHLFVAGVDDIDHINTAYFSPSIIQSLGYSNIETQLHSVPPYACAFVLGMLFAALSDHIRHRFIFIILGAMIAMAGFVILLVVQEHDHLRYGAIFMAAMGIYSSIPVIVCWVTMNCEWTLGRTGLVFVSFNSS